MYSLSKAALLVGPWGADSDVWVRWGLSGSSKFSGSLTALRPPKDCFHAFCSAACYTMQINNARRQHTRNMSL
eukprot:1160468-Pelagomonas_calceolata.AAC.1